MNENPRTLTKVGMKYGLIYGVALIGVSLIFYLLGTDLQSKIPQVLSYGVLLAVIIIGTKAYRDEDLGGFISYSKALGTGIVISFFGSIIVAFYMYLFFSFIDPSMTDKILETAQQQMMEKGLPDDQVEMAVEMQKKFMTPGWMFAFTILGYTFFGFILSLITSIFIRRNQENPFNSNVQ